jgi:predicted Zn-dependent peptidase
MLFRSLLPVGNFEKERGIILEELEKDREGESYLLGRILEAETYPHSTFGLPVLGTEESIRRLPRGEVYAYYKKHYVPENMCAILLGGFDPDEARTALEQTLGAEPPAGLWLDPVPAPPAITSDRVMRHGLGVSRSRVRVIWNGPKPADPHFVAAQAAASLLLGGDSSPLGVALQSAFPGEVLSVSGRLEAGSGFGRLIIDLAVAAGTPLDDVLASVLTHVRKLDAPDDAHIEAWKIARRAEQIFARQRSYMFAPLYSETVALRGLWGLEARLGQVSAMNPDDVRAASRSLAVGPHWAILIEATDAPEGGAPAGMPGMGMPPGMGAHMPSGMPPAGKAPTPATDPGTKPADASQRAELKHDDLDPYPVAIETLTSGARLLHMGAPPDGSLSIYVLIEGRNYLEPEGREGITELLHRLMTTGAGNLDEAAFQLALERVGGDVQTADMGFIPFDDYYTASDFSFVRFQALDEYAGDAFELLGLMLREPRFDAALIERERNQLVVRVGRDAEKGKGIATSELRGLLFDAAHPEARVPYGMPHSVAAITAEDLRAYHKRLLDPHRIWIGVVSGHSVAEITGWAERLLPKASPSPTLQMSPERYELWQQRDRLGEIAAERWAQALAGVGGASSVPGAGEVRVVQGSGRRGRVLEALLLPAQIPGLDPEAGAANAYHVATGVLSSRLAFDLREQKGMAYGIGASLTPIGEHLLYVAGAGTRRENLEAMSRGMVAIRRQFAPSPSSDGADPQADEIARIASKQYGRTLRRQEIRLNQAMFCVWAARDGDDPLRWWHAAEARRNLPPEQVRAALRAIAKRDDSVVIVVQ